jgi:hypothetical protein
MGNRSSMLNPSGDRGRLTRHSISKDKDQGDGQEDHEMADGYKLT